MTSQPSPLDGVWELIRARLDGDDAPELMTSNTRLELAAGDYLVRFGGEISDQGHFELGGTRELNTILMHGVKGTNAGRTIPCIYQHKGELLRVCYGLGGEAPTEFAAEIGQKQYLATYRRTRSENRPRGTTDG